MAEAATKREQRVHGVPNASVWVAASFPTATVVERVAARVAAAMGGTTSGSRSDSPKHEAPAVAPPAQADSGRPGQAKGPHTMHQNLREAELALARKRAEMTLLREEAASLRAEHAQVSEVARSLDEDIAKAIQDGNDEWARRSIRRLLPHRETLRGLAARIDTVSGRLDRLSETVAAQEECFIELKSRLRAQLDANRRAVAGSGSGPEIRLPVLDSDVEVELLRRQRQALDELRAC